MIRSLKKKQSLRFGAQIYHLDFLTLIYIFVDDEQASFTRECILYMLLTLIPYTCQHVQIV